MIDSNLYRCMSIVGKYTNNVVSGKYLEMVKGLNDFIDNDEVIYRCFEQAVFVLHTESGKFELNDETVQKLTDDTVTIFQNEGRQMLQNISEELAFRMISSHDDGDYSDITQLSLLIFQFLQKPAE